MSSFPPHVAEATLVKALQALLAQWPALDYTSAQAVHAALAAHAPRLQQAAGRFEPVTLAAEMLGVLDEIKIPPVRRRLAPVLEPARQAAAMRGLAFSNPAAAQEIQNLLAQLLQQPMPRPQAWNPTTPAAWTTATAPVYHARPYPADRPSYWPATASRVLPEIAQALLADWNNLDPATQAALCGLFWETASRLEETTSTHAQGAAAVWFLEQIELIAPANPGAQALLRAAVNPPAVPKGDVMRDFEPPRPLQPGVVDLLRQAGVSEPQASTALPPTGGDDKGVHALPPSDDEEAVVQRYGAVEFPGKVLHKLAVRLTVRLTEQQVASAVNTITPMSLQTGAAHPVTVVVLAPDFVIFDGAWTLANTGELLVKTAGDSDPLIFELLPKSPGAKAIAVDFRQNDRLLGTVNLAVTVVSEYADLGVNPAQALSTQAAMTMPDRDLPPPQLELRIKAADQDQKVFEFILHSKLAGFNWKSMGSQPFSSQPAELMKSCFQALNDLARQQGGDLPDAEKQAQLNTLGENLFGDAFPEALQRALWAMPSTITDLIITSDEPWIPWELARTYDLDTRAEGDFLCSRFHVARWLAGDGMVATLPNRQVTAIVPSSNLPYAAAELDALQAIQPGLISVTDVAASVAPVRQLLQSNLAGILHFACHGNLDTTDPTNSALKLSGGSLRVADLSRSVRYRQHPLVFLNACESGGLGFALSGLGGWAERFVRAGAGAFIGTLWEVNDALAAEFAATFYASLFQGAALGAAFAAAREAVRAKDSNNPTWLAYVLYGEPLSQLQTTPT